MGAGSRELWSSPRASLRRAKALEWLRARRRDERLVVVGASVEAAAELIRDAAVELARDPSAFGWQRGSLMTLASAIAAPELARLGLAPIAPLSLEALCARLLHLDAQAGAARKSAHAEAAEVFDPWLPGAARALAQTLGELRLEGVTPAQLAPVKPGLARLFAALEDALERERLCDPARLLALARLGLPRSELRDRPLLWLDAPIATRREAELAAALASNRDVLALLPAGDSRSLALLQPALGAASRTIPSGEHDPLARLQTRLFAANAAIVHDNLAQEPPGDRLEIFSAPGEGRECVEIARRVLEAAARGMPFERMAVLLRQPGLYRPLMEEALARAQIPAWFHRGSTRPDPSGRAFLALLACADEGLSASRFAEYLSLGEVPALEPAAPAAVAPRDSALLPGAVGRAIAEGAAPQDEGEPPARGSFRWEPLLIDAAVIGGREIEDARGRWKRRLQALRGELERDERELAVEEEQRAAQKRRQREDLGSLWAFAEPLLAQLEALPRGGTWAAWLDALGPLARASLRRPERVLAVLEELRPLGAVGPISLTDVQLALSRSLSELSEPPPAHRPGRLFVGPIEAARGRSFAQVFVPGLAERLFPPKALQDPLLRDRERARLDALRQPSNTSRKSEASDNSPRSESIDNSPKSESIDNTSRSGETIGRQLAGGSERIAGERLQLHLAAGAAEERLVLSWPRLELQLGRARVPSFYALEALFAAEGKLPGFAELSRRAERAAEARAAWPAPLEPKRAIDAAEYDLALVGEALRKPEAETRGVGRYLLGANPALKRALYRRAERAPRRKKWFPADGLVDPAPEAREALARHQLDARSYSASALQNYAACPYRFFLQAIHRLEPREEPHPIDEIDPLSRGSLMHEIQFALFSSLRAEGLLPLHQADPAETRRRLERALEQLRGFGALEAAKWRDLLAPAIERVWLDCVSSILGDLSEWLRRVSLDAEWIPEEFERSFGLTDAHARDARSQREPAQLEGGLQLRGSIDLVERSRSGVLRATDYKSGRRRAEPGIVIDGGKTLQPVLYALALEQLFPGAKIEGGQLYYCTHTGEYAQIPVPLDEHARGAERLLAKTVGEALRDGFFPAAPRKDECKWCDYVEICGDGEEARAAGKSQERLVQLNDLRGSP